MDGSPVYQFKSVAESKLRTEGHAYRESEARMPRLTEVRREVRTESEWGEEGIMETLRETVAQRKGLGIIGSAGTGKSQLTRALIEMLKAEGIPCHCVGPTHCSARQFSPDDKASTLHRFLLSKGRNGRVPKLSGYIICDDLHQSRIDLCLDVPFPCEWRGPALGSRGRPAAVQGRCGLLVWERWGQ